MAFSSTSMDESSMAPAPPGVRDSARRTLSNKIMHDTVVFEEYGYETDGAYTKARITVKPGGGTPLHYHRSYGEEFHPVSGTLGLVKGAETLSLPPGSEHAVVPPGTYHRFFNASPDSDVTFVGLAKPAHEGFEKGLYILYGLANDGLSDSKGLPKSLVHLCLCADMSDMYFPGPMAWFGTPFVKAVAAYGRWTGEEERLLKKYWF